MKYKLIALLFVPCALYGMQRDSSLDEALRAFEECSVPPLFCEEELCEDDEPIPQAPEAAPSIIIDQVAVQRADAEFAHMLALHAKDKDPLKCFICVARHDRHITFKNARLLRNHLRRHVSVKPYTCVKCGRIFKIFRDASLHHKRCTGKRQSRRYWPSARCSAPKKIACNTKIACDVSEKEVGDLAYAIYDRVSNKI